MNARRAACGWLTPTLALVSCDTPAPPMPERKVEAPVARVAKPDREREKSPRDLAVAAVFGANLTRPVRVSAGKQAIFSRARLVRASGQDILIAPGKALGAAHPDPGYLGIWYLDRRRDGFAVQKAWPGYIAAGTFGEPPDWKLRDDLGPQTVIEANGFGMWHGHAFTCTTLVALGPDGPRMLVGPLLTSYQFDPENDPAETETFSQIAATLSRDRGGDLIVSYRGTLKTILSFRRAGDTFVKPKLPTVLDRC